MSTKRVSTIVLVAGLVLLAVSISPRIANPVRALPPVQEGVTIPYPGRLADEVGQAVADGAYDFVFALYEAQSGGEPLWTEMQEGIAVRGGTFTALLGGVDAIPADVLSGETRWLEVAVRGPDEDAFTTLAPRQELSAVGEMDAAPQALSCEHTHVGEEWVADIPWSNGAFKIYNYGNGPGIWGWNGGGGNGLRGSAMGSGIGVYGESQNGTGVVGRSTDGRGVAGYSTAGYGVYGESETGFGLVARGNDYDDTDSIGDLLLEGDFGEIFAPGGDMWLSTARGVALHLDSDDDENACFTILDTDYHLVSLTCENGTKSAVLQTESHGQRAVYALESPEVWLEDFGTASLVDGEATVAFDPIFAETVNLEMDYHVFVTPLCQEPVLLFVTAKIGTGFVVKGVTLDNQPADCAFDYRVVAKRLGVEDLRLEPVADSR
ncbi:MAG: hypothetical protein JW918_16865 [Anaerolineae bacterium]|nr:hypothetical protein [Anaerolineae bacterium]